MTKILAELAMLAGADTRAIWGGGHTHAWPDAAKHLNEPTNDGRRAGRCMHTPRAGQSPPQANEWLLTSPHTGSNAEQVSEDMADGRMRCFVFFMFGPRSAPTQR